MMKKLCLILLMLGVLRGFCPNNDFEVIKVERFNDNEITLFAIIDYESAWGKFPYNKTENAAGHIQIRPMVVLDVNRYFNTNYTLQDRFDLNKSIEIFWKYQHMCKGNTPEELARKWNGGPKGMYKSTTLGYWKQIQKRIKKYEHLKYTTKIIKDERIR